MGIRRARQVRLDGRQYRRRKALYPLLEHDFQISKMSKLLFRTLEFLILASTAPSMHVTVHERVKVNL